VDAVGVQVHPAAVAVPMPAAVHQMPSRQVWTILCKVLISTDRITTPAKGLTVSPLCSVRVGKPTHAEHFLKIKS